MKIPEHIWSMKLAIEQAEKAYKEGEVPIGAVVVHSATGKVIARAHNTKEKDHNPCGHAEINALISAGEKIGNWRLNGHVLYATLSPCPMCMASFVHARIDGIVFGAYDFKGGALELGFDLNRNKKLNHRFFVQGGILQYECSKMLSQFFKERRNNY